MLDKYIYQSLHFIMKWSGQINSWAWRKHAKILRSKQSKDMEALIRNQENNAYLEELKKKLWVNKYLYQYLTGDLVLLS